MPVTLRTASQSLVEDDLGCIAFTITTGISQQMRSAVILAPPPVWQRRWTCRSTLKLPGAYRDLVVQPQARV
eukprot:scaffold290659_cov19-Prasinocladus_malaysianus.AAC.1